MRVFVLCMCAGEGVKRGPITYLWRDVRVHACTYVFVCVRLCVFLIRSLQLTWNGILTIGSRSHRETRCGLPLGALGLGSGEHSRDKDGTLFSPILVSLKENSSKPRRPGILGLTL